MCSEVTWPATRLARRLWRRRMRLGATLLRSHGLRGRARRGFGGRGVMLAKLASRALAGTSERLAAVGTGTIEAAAGGMGGG